MSTKIGDLAVYISANTYGLARDLTRASSLVTDFGGRTLRQMAGVGRSLASAFRDAGVVTAGDLLAGGIRAAAGGVRDLAADSVKLAAAGEVTAMRFETLAGNIDAAKEAMADLRALAANSPVSTADAFKLGGGLLSAGLPRDQLAATLGRLSDLTGDRQQLADLTRAYTQVYTTGRLQLDEWNQIANTGTINFKDLGKAIGKDEGEVKKFIESGRVGFHHLQLAIKQATDEGGRFYKMGERYSGTMAGKLDKLQDSWDELKTTFGAAIIEEMGLKQGADDVAAYTDGMKGLVDAARPALKWLGELGRGFAQLGAEGGRAFIEIGDVMVDKLAARFPETSKWLKETIGDLKELKLSPEGIANFAVGVGDAFGDVIEGVRDFGTTIYDSVISPISEGVAWIAKQTDDISLTWAQIKDLKDDGGREAKLLREREERARKEARIAETADRFNISKLTAGRLLDTEALLKLRKDQLAGAGANAIRGLAGQFPDQAFRDFKREDMFAESPTALAAAIRRTLDADPATAKLRPEIAGLEKQVELLKGKADPLSVKSLTERFARTRAADEARARWRAEQSIFDTATGPGDFRILTPAVESRLSDLAGKLNERFADPLKKLAEEVADLDALKNAGKIDAGVYGRAVQDLLPGGAGGPPLATAAEAGSQQLASMVARASAGQGPNDVPALLERIRALLEEQNRIGGRIEQGVNQAPVVVSMPE